jgi:hypothetical protein
LLPSGADLHQDFPGALPQQYPAGQQSTIVRERLHVCLTANTGSSNNAQSLVLMIEHQDFTVAFTACGGTSRGTSDHQLQRYGEGDGADDLPSRRIHPREQQRGVGGGDLQEVGDDEIQPVKSGTSTSYRTGPIDALRFGGERLSGDRANRLVEGGRRSLVDVFQ